MAAASPRIRGIETPNNARLAASPGGVGTSATSMARISQGKKASRSSVTSSPFPSRLTPGKRICPESAHLRPTLFVSLPLHAQSLCQPTKISAENVRTIVQSLFIDNTCSGTGTLLVRSHQWEAQWPHHHLLPCARLFPEIDTAEPPKIALVTNK